MASQVVDNKNKPRLFNGAYSIQSLMSYRLNDLPAVGGDKRAARMGNFPTLIRKRESVNRACGAARHAPDGLCG